ncbi:maleylpyruvate isomerase family mycothiol-dependent enzyme [Nocardioides sp. zg-1228]|uniref:maleylpyruvate isomerase family mycothiol-dependent enzyme n=1 Tax=Nocardioides sp. zg-1228 TaxID=2763008 RepID=UPI00164282C5|nr:maleylpyruvate isomerase family mycothiol-dependent enzyme [Nocardioides sp. zg-1228]MBC2931864.1 maleylpyruvate isomerase family mycothiol-dependent enzyme [Nocardioides sp. zg-1228]QSF57429.1 maleylpyruvate isomerase family mycothiol-dependent enzyme [Nocardioides sp. zg-1228]
MDDVRRDPRTDQDRLAALVTVWWEAVDSFTRLLEGIGEDGWRTSTDLPGWDVHAVAAHTAHLEALLAGRPHDEGEVGDAAHLRGAMVSFTEQGVLARRDHTPDALITEIRESATARHARLLADPPTDPSAPAPGAFGAIGWTTELLLRNRPLDVWMHEQDVRRALDLPGNLDSAPAVHTTDYLLESLPYVVAKRAQAPVGSVVRLAVSGHPPATVVVGQDGRGRPAGPGDGEPALTLATDREGFVLLAGGRRAADRVDVRLSGDAALGERVLASMAVTP